MYEEREPWKIRQEYDTRFLMRQKEAREREEYLMTIVRYHQQRAAN